MKRVSFFLALLITLFLASCAGEEKTCEETGCDTGKHCIIEKNQCVQDCTADYCAVIGEICNDTTKECEPSCMDTGCVTGEVCDESQNKCIDSCIEVQCAGATHCNLDSKLCDEDCTAESCTGEGEVCDPESKTCVVKASNSCDDSSCVEGSHCNTTTGHCVGGCADIDCPGGKVCNPSLLRCVNECSVGVCRGESFCNLDSKLCEAFVDYPTAAKGTEKGDIIKNLSWVDVDKKNISLRKYHSMYKKTGYPKVMILIASAGWCSPCRQEAPLMRDFYDSMILPNGQERLAIVQTIIDDNSMDGVLSSPDAFAKSWRDQYGMKFSVVGDPADPITHKSSLDDYNPEGGIPFNMIINLKNMEIADLQNGTDEVLGSVKSKVREVEKEILCKPLNCDKANGHYCIYNRNNGSAECS